MATEMLYKKIMETYHREISNNPVAMNLAEVGLIEQNPQLLRTAFTEAWSDHTENNFSTIQGLFERINQVHPIPETLRLFSEYRKS